MNRSDSALSRAVDLFLFSGLCPAAVAAAFVAVCHEALFGGAAPMPWSAITLAAAGTLVVYTLDRLRDLSEDGLSSPARTDFVRRNATLLMTFCGLALGISALTAWQQPPLAWLFLALAFGLGVFHRRLKGHPTFGILYVAAAWVAIPIAVIPVACAILVACAIFICKKLSKLRLCHRPLIKTICYIIDHQYNPM